MTWLTQRLSQQSPLIGLRCLLALATVGVTLGSLSAAQAALFSVDFQNAGDGLITRDTATGLEWLDLTPTQNLSYQSVATGAGGFTTTAGFRFATQAELTDLLAAANQDPTALPSGVTGGFFNIIGDPQGVYLLNKFLGTVSPAQEAVLRSGAAVGIGATGYFGTPNVDGTVGAAKLLFNQSASVTYGSQVLLRPSLLGTLGFAKTADLSGVGYASFLVRSAATRSVPEPGSLVGLGLVAIVGWRRWRRA
jgi:hypothetical protein